MYTIFENFTIVGLGLDGLHFWASDFKNQLMLDKLFYPKNCNQEYNAQCTSTLIKGKQFTNDDGMY